MPSRGAHATRLPLSEQMFAVVIELYEMCIKYGQQSKCIIFKSSVKTTPQRAALLTIMSHQRCIQCTSRVRPPLLDMSVGPTEVFDGTKGTK